MPIISIAHKINLTMFTILGSLGAGHETPHLAGAVVIPLRIAPEKMLVFSESLPYTSLEIGQKRIFHLWP